MSRPGLRPMRALPMLETRRSPLEKCVFCPKLCRTACPVSNAEPRETLTPWGKMSLAWMTAHGDVPVERSYASPAWACTGCFACRELCDHENPVTDVLLDARSALASAGVPPEGARLAIERFPRHDAQTRRWAGKMASHPRVRADARDALLIGCGYVRGARREALDAIDATTALTGEPIALVEACCGLPLRLAGDAAGFAERARAMAKSLARRARVVVVDSGCALALRQSFGDLGIEIVPRVDLLVELAARNLWKLSHVAGAEAVGPVRWHDPCQLGRGLGIFDAPRAVLARALGRPADEFRDRREHAVCSGGGGLLPSTMPAVARSIAHARIGEHDGEGGGRIVTACASSLLALRKATAGSGVVVEDLVSWIARASPR